MLYGLKPNVIYTRYHHIKNRKVFVWTLKIPRVIAVLPPAQASLVFFAHNLYLFWKGFQLIKTNRQSLSLRALVWQSREIMSKRFFYSIDYMLIQHKPSSSTWLRIQTAFKPVWIFRKGVVCYLKVFELHFCLQTTKRLTMLSNSWIAVLRSQWRMVLLEINLLNYNVKININPILSWKLLQA